MAGATDVILHEETNSLSTWDENNPALLTGDSAIFQIALRWQTELFSARRKIFNLDCSMRFNAFQIVQDATEQNINPDLILENILVQRAFTPYQILDATHRLLEEPASRNQVNIYLAPFKQFFDGDVAKDEARHLLEELILLIHETRRRRIPLIIVEKESYDHPAFLSVYSKLKLLSNPVWNLSRIKRAGETHLLLRTNINERLKIQQQKSIQKINAGRENPRLAYA